MTDTFWNWAPLSHLQGGKGGKKSMKLNWNFLERGGGEGVQNKNLLWGDPVGGLRIFFGNTHFGKADIEIDSNKAGF